MDKNQKQNFKGLLIGVRVPNIKTNLYAKISLKYRGYKDGKKNIPFQDSNLDWISPTIQDEKAKINSFMSRVCRGVNNQNKNVFNSTKVAIAKFEEKVSEIEKIYYFLGNKLSIYETLENATLTKKLTPEQELMLNSRRISEKELDEIPLRIRRLNEYNKPFLPLRAQLEKAMTEMEINYEEIIKNYTELELLDETIQSIFFDVNARIDKRLSWYWQGVICKHNERDKIEINTSVTPKFDVKDLYDSHRKKLEKSIEQINQKREEILKLPII